MKIVIATPFYPPETEKMAVYAKELAERLAAIRHEVVVVAYARLPEESQGVRIVAVDKRLPLFFRLIAYAVSLFCETRKADVLYAGNGASVELPVGIVALLSRCPLFMHRGDKTADIRASKNFFLRVIKDFTKKHTRGEIIDIPLAQPEILPFEPAPLLEQAAYYASWDAHIKKLLKIFRHV